MYQQKCQEMDEIPIGWTLFNNGLMSANFHQLKEMGGLCSICTESESWKLSKQVDRTTYQTLVAKKWGRMPNFLYERKSKIFLQPEK